MTWLRAFPAVYAHDIRNGSLEILNLYLDAKHKVPDFSHALRRVRRGAQRYPVVVQVLMPESQKAGPRYEWMKHATS